MISVFVTDQNICNTIKRQLQQVLNNLQKLSNKNSFKFSKIKTKCMHLFQLLKHHLNPELTLDGTRIEVVVGFKFLGLLFDPKLTFIPHIKYLRNNCQKG